LIARVVWLRTFSSLKKPVNPSKKGVSMGKKFLIKERFVLGSIGTLSALLFIMVVCLIMPISVLAADKLVVKDGTGTTTFKVEDTGAITTESRLLANGASAWGSAPMVLGQDTGNRGMIVTDKASSNPKNLYFGWDLQFDHVELIALQEGVAYKNIVLAPSGGNVGIGTTSPSYPLQMGSGAYVSSGGVWTNASSREYKKDIRELTGDEAMDALKQLSPVKFSYKSGSEENHVGFIAEDVPALVATKDRKGMSSMDVVAVLTKVVQEQQKLVYAQQKSMDELARKVVALEGRLGLNNNPEK
jgi:hypothetical protein